MNLVKKVGPPFSQDSPETKSLEKDAQNSLLFIYQCIMYNLEMKYVLLCETFLVQKLEVLLNDDFLLFKEGIPSIQLIKNYRCISESYS